MMKLLMLIGINLKMEKNIGSLEIGKDAQLLAYDGDSIRWIEGIGM